MPIRWKNLRRPRSWPPWILIAITVVGKLSDLSFLASLSSQWSFIASQLDTWGWLVAIVLGVIWLSRTGRTSRTDMLRAARLVRLEADMLVRCDNDGQASEEDEIDRALDRLFLAVQDHYGPAARTAPADLHDTHFPIYNELREVQELFEATDEVSVKPFVALWKPLTDLRVWISNTERDLERNRLKR